MSLLSLILFHRVMYSLFFASAALGSQGNRLRSSRYKNTFIRCVDAALLLYVNMVSKSFRYFLSSEARIIITIGIVQICADSLGQFTPNI